MKDEPFTKEEVDYFNQFSHFTVDINKEFKERITAIENEIKNEFGEIPESLKTPLYYYRKALYEWYLAEAEARAVAPPVSVVGPSKYGGRPERAEKIMEKSNKALETAKYYLEKGIKEEREKKRRKEIEKTKTITFDDLQKLKKDLGLTTARLIYHNRHKDGSGNFGMLLEKGEKKYEICGAYYPSKIIKALDLRQHLTPIRDLEVNTYEELLSELKKVFGEEKPGEEKPFYYQETLTEEKEKQLRFAAPVYRRKELTEEEAKIKTEQKKLPDEKQKGLEYFLGVITLVGMMGLMYLIKKR